MHLFAKAHPNFWCDVVNLIVEPRREERDATPNAQVVGDTISETRKEELIVGEVALTFFEHLSRWREEEARGIWIGEPVLTLVHPVRLRFFYLANVVCRDCYVTGGHLEIDTVGAYGCD